MSLLLISRSEDLRRLQEEGYEVEIRNGHLVIGHVPYVTPAKSVAYGSLVSTLTLAGDITTTPDTHVVSFAGEMPCDQYGQPLTRIHHSAGDQALADGLTTNHIFSSKPSDGYANYYDKMTAYIRILAGHAQAIDEHATAKTHRVILSEEDSVFEYMETASTRAGIVAATDKLRVDKVAIVGLGGTGSYILDFIAKTPVREIHLFDGDSFLQHNAFRSPGAASLEELGANLTKVEYLRRRYAHMHRGIVAHPKRIDETNVEELSDQDFVFLAIDDGASRKLIVEHLESFGVAFIDVGIGVIERDGSLGALVRTTTSTPEHRDHVRERNLLPFTAGDNDDDYRRNIQVAELNALNAVHAVLKWKKLAGFYRDFEQEYHSLYTTDGNRLLNED